MHQSLYLNFLNSPNHLFQTSPFSSCHPFSAPPVNPQTIWSPPTLSRKMDSLLNSIPQLPTLGTTHLFTSIYVHLYSKIPPPVPGKPLILCPQTNYLLPPPGPASTSISFFQYPLSSDAFLSADQCAKISPLTLHCSGYCPVPLFPFSSYIHSSFLYPFYPSLPTATWILPLK